MGLFKSSWFNFVFRCLNEVTKLPGHAVVQSIVEVYSCDGCMLEINSLCVPVNPSVKLNTWNIYTEENSSKTGCFHAW